MNERKEISFEMCSSAVVSALLFIELKSTLHFNEAISVFNLKFSIKKRRTNTFIVQPNRDAIEHLGISYSTPPIDCTTVRPAIHPSERPIVHQK